MVSKYRAKPITIDGIRFASTKEGNHYRVLKDRLRCGEISDLKLQPRFKLVVLGKKICTYVADFEYIEVATGELITCDVKGVRTREYIIKAKLVKALFGIDILEV